MENVIAGSPIEPEPVPGFGYLILSDCGAKGRAWLVAFVSTSQGILTGSSAGAIKGRRFSEEFLGHNAKFREAPSVVVLAFLN